MIFRIVAAWNRSHFCEPSTERWVACRRLHLQEMIAKDLLHLSHQPLQLWWQLLTQEQPAFQSHQQWQVIRMVQLQRLLLGGCNQQNRRLPEDRLLLSRQRQQQHQHQQQEEQLAVLVVQQQPLSPTMTTQPFQFRSMLCLLWFKALANRENIERIRKIATNIWFVPTVDCLHNIALLVCIGTVSISTVIGH
jgi:hypothetical protein